MTRSIRDHQLFFLTMVHLTRGAHVRLTLGIDYILKTPASSSTRSRHLTIRTNLFFLISIRRGKSTTGCPYLFSLASFQILFFFYPPLGYIQFGSAQALQPELPRNSKLSFPFFGDFPLNLTRSGKWCDSSPFFCLCTFGLQTVLDGCSTRASGFPSCWCAFLDPHRRLGARATRGGSVPARLYRLVVFPTPTPLQPTPAISSRTKNKTKQSFSHYGRRGELRWDRNDRLTKRGCGSNHFFYPTVFQLPLRIVDV